MKSKIPLSPYKPRKFISLSIPILIISIFTTTSSCALFQKKNLRLTTAVEENLVPEESPWKLIAAPLYIPVGIVAGLLDVFVVHPIAVVPDAATDTIDVLWTPKGLGYYTQMGAIPFSLLATPPFFALAWSYHWLFEDRSRSQEPEMKLSYSVWKLEIQKSIDEKNKKEFRKLFPQFYNHETSNETIHLLIQARETFSSQDIAHEILDAILIYPIENETARNYILKDYERTDDIYRHTRFIQRCNLLDCRKAVLSKLQNTKDPDKLSELVRLYISIATDEEKEKFLNQLRSLK
ncbi:MAG: hypothetical protein JJT78_10765 [Leptospira sp.]|nr:hypothetical protein [Leptospira sp.]